MAVVRGLYARSDLHGGKYFSLSSAGFSLRVLVLACTNPRRLKPALLKPLLSASSWSPRRDNANERDHGQCRSRIKCHSIILVSVKKHAADGGPKNPSKPPSSKDRSIIRTGIPHAPKIGHR